MEKESINEIDLLIAKSKSLYSYGNYEEAIKVLKDAEKINPAHGEIYLEMASSYILLDKYEEARWCLNKALMVDKNNSFAYYQLGNIALLEGKPDEAKAHYSKAELLGLVNATMNFNLAIFYEEMHEYDKALEQYNKLLFINPYDYEVLEAKTKMLMKASRFEDSFNSAKKMIETNIDCSNGFHYFYVSLIMMNRYDEALKIIEECIKRFPEDKNVLYDYARICDLMGDKDKALETIEKHFKDDESHDIAFLKFGLLLQKNMLKEAIELSDIVKSLHDNVQTLMMLFSIYYYDEQYDKCLETLGKIREFGRDNEQYIATYYFGPLVRSKINSVEKVKDEFLDSIKLLSKFAVDNPERVDAYLYRALCYAKIEKYKESIDDVEFLCAVAPKQALVHIVAYSIYDLSGNLEEAIKHKEIAKELDPNVIGPML